MCSYYDNFDPKKAAQQQAQARQQALGQRSAIPPLAVGAAAGGLISGTTQAKFDATPLEYLKCDLENTLSALGTEKHKEENNMNVYLPQTVYDWISGLSRFQHDYGRLGYSNAGFHGPYGTYQIIPVKDKEYVTNKQKKLDNFEEVSYYDDGEYEWVMMKKPSSNRSNKPRKRKSKKKNSEMQLNDVKRA